MNRLQEILDARASKGLDSSRYSYKLREGEYALDAVVNESPKVDVHRMCLHFPYADGNRRDNVGDLLDIEGISLERHRKNPMVLYDHGKEITLPVAMSQDPETRSYTVILDPVAKQAWVSGFWYDGKGTNTFGLDKDQFEALAQKLGGVKAHALFCEQLFDMMARGFVRGGSIGYLILGGYELSPDPRNTGAPGGVHLQNTLQLEASATALPAHMDTVMKCLSSGSCGKPLNPWLKKDLRQAAISMGWDPRRGIKSVTPVPRGKDHSKTNVPPARWEPGAGAVVPKAKDGSNTMPEAKSQPSNKISPDKAKQILKDGTANGKPLTDKQRGMFGAAAGKGDKGLEENGRNRVGLEASEERTQVPKGTADDSASGGISGAGKSFDAAEHSHDSHPTGADDEPHSSIVRRRVHEDNGILLEDYHELNKLLEHPPTKKFLEKKLTGLSKEMDDLETLHKEHHPHLPPLGEGKKDGEDMGPAVEADSSAPAGAAPGGVQKPMPQPEPSEEQMDAETKNLQDKYRKGIRDLYKQKSLLGVLGKQIPGNEEFQPKPGQQGVDPDGSTDLGEEEFQHKPGNPMGGSDPAAGTDMGEEENQPAPGQTEPTLAPHHKKVCAKAASYLKDLASGGEYDDEKRLDAHHYFKAMEDVAMEAGGGLPEDPQGEPEASAETGGGIPPVEESHLRHAQGEKGFSEAGHADAEVNITKRPASHVVKEAAGLLRDISKTDTLSDIHRGRAEKMSGLLGPLGEQAREAGITGGGKSLENVISRQKAQMATLQKTMAELMTRISG